MKHIIFAFLLAVVACGCKKNAGAAAGAVDPNITTCAARLKTISDAKQHWANALNRSADDVPTIDDLRVYLRGMPECPAGGTYTLGKVSEPPHCSIAEHQAAFEALLKEAPTQ